MNPPAEQLIRDYLNRVSVAARGRLSPDDRRAFVARTRELIEQNTRGLGQGSPMGVARFLNGLGDPAALVARECDRLVSQPPGTSPASPPGGTARPPRTGRERRPRSGPGAWIDRLRPSAAPLSGVPVPRPAGPGGTARNGAVPHGTAPHSTAPDGTAADGTAAAVGEAAGGEPSPRRGTPRTVLAGDVVTGHVPTGDEPLPGPASESVSRPVPGGVQPGSGRRGWPFQGMDPAGAGPIASANGHGPVRPDSDSASAPGPGLAPDSGTAPESGVAPDSGTAPESGVAPDSGTAPESEPGSGPGLATAGSAAPEPGDDAPVGPPLAAVDAAAGPAGSPGPASTEPDELSSAASAPRGGDREETDREETDREEADREEIAERSAAPDIPAATGRVPSVGSAPVIGRWAGGTPVTGNLAGIPLPETANGRASLNGHQSPASAAAGTDDGNIGTGGAGGEGAGTPDAAVPQAGAAADGEAAGEQDDQAAAEAAAAAGAAVDADDPGPDITGSRSAGNGWITAQRRGASRWPGWPPARRARPRVSWPRLTRPRSAESPQARPSAGEPPPGRPASPRPRPYLPRRPSSSRPAPPSPTGSRPVRLRPSLPRPSRPALPSGTLATVGARTRKVLRYLGGQARQRPLEATAVVLIGLGGAVYPPVWILGAVLALASRVWDFRDKWLGLVIPVFVVIVGMGADVSLGGTRSGVGAYFREAWIFGSHLSRIVAVLGAVYLAWRSQQPRRHRSPEPWKKSRRFN